MNDDKNCRHARALRIKKRKIDHQPLKNYITHSHTFKFKSKCLLFQIWTLNITKFIWYSIFVVAIGSVSPDSMMLDISILYIYTRTHKQILIRWSFCNVTLEPFAPFPFSHPRSLPRSLSLSSLFSHSSAHFVLNFYFILFFSLLFFRPIQLD